MSSVRRHRASITEVAKEAGVSTATVSRTFSHPNKVLDATRKKVLSASKKLGFSISRAPGILKSGRSYRIALLVGSEENRVVHGSRDGRPALRAHPGRL